MYRTENFVYVHFQKTGGTHVKKLLIDVFGKEKEASVWHGSLTELDREKFAFCGIRNPWDFYVSLFHHSKEQSSPPINYFRSIPELYQNTYLNPDVVEGFRIWLGHVLNGSVMDRNSLLLPRKLMHKAGRRLLLMNKLDRMINVKPWSDVGMMSRWLFGVVVPGYRTMRIRDFKEFVSIFEEKSLVNYYYKLESLTEDMRYLMENHLCPDDGWEESFSNWSNKKSNTTNRLKNYQAYYDQRLLDMVTDKEQLIISKFGYQF